jgi:ferredoxin
MKICTMTTTYRVDIHHAGESFSFEAPENETILNTAKAAQLELPNSCCAGVCTTCAAKILEGEVEQGDAMGLGPETIAQGFALLCVAYPRSNLKIEAGQEEIVYNLQFGQFQS